MKLPSFKFKNKSDTNIIEFKNPMKRNEKKSFDYLIGLILSTLHLLLIKYSKSEEEKHDHLKEKDYN